MKYQPNPQGVQALDRTPEMMKFLKDEAEKAAAAAKGFAPVLTGTYRDSIKADSKISDGKATGFIYATDFKAVWIEYGTSTNPTYAPLRKGVEAAGLKVKER